MERKRCWESYESASRPAALIAFYFYTLLPPSYASQLVALGTRDSSAGTNTFAPVCGGKKKPWSTMQQEATMASMKYIHTHRAPGSLLWLLTLRKHNVPRCTTVINQSPDSIWKCCCRANGFASECVMHLHLIRIFNAAECLCPLELRRGLMAVEGWGVCSTACLTFYLPQLGNLRHKWRK